MISTEKKVNAIKYIKTVKNGLASVIVPEEFGDKVEIIILPIKEKKYIRKNNIKSILDIAGKIKLSENILIELENGRKEDRF
jgi:hypothetical protein